MQAMFEGATAFNGPLNSWNVENVMDMESMFEDAITFNQPLQDWNIENVESMERMFYNAIAFEQPLHAWQGRHPGSSMFDGALNYIAKYGSELN
jgi:surface protein